ncbi:MFS general substrate transporter [Lecanosticta acicola]|uniref:Cercosporin MFS transporter CTB4 n=1 Tax=Lecanosticta acicola TaxID=111012 RepID=A0AAI8YYY6_9PEZI|nr:MFS general substrate transporter [Lecanosticta acicola]
MATTKHHTPGFLGGDLPEYLETAYQEGHDADIPTNATTTQEVKQQTPAVRPDSNISDLEKADPNERSEATSITSPVTGVAAAHEPEKAPAEVTEAVENPDPNIVSWDSDDDPANPVNWSTGLKWGNIAVLSTLTFLTPLASSMFAPGVPQLMREFGTDSSTLATFVVSIYVLGFAVGPLLIAPASELYGRLIVYHVTTIAFIIFTVACALAPSMSSLIVFRFLQGCWGVTPVTIGGGTIADLMAPEKRGAAMAIWAMGPLLGPVIGPVAGGFLAEAKDWRWIFWVIAMATGFTFILALLFLRETYAPILLARKTKHLQKATGNMDLRSKLDNGLSPKQLFIRAIVRPSKLMFLSPICGLMSLYMAIVYGFLYLLFTTFTFVFEEYYGFSQSTVGLVYIGLGVGNFIGLGVIGGSSDRMMNYLAKKKGGGIKPEYRLPLLMYAGPFIPVGLFIYGWTAQYHVQWAVPLLGTLFVGVGLMGCFMCINTYLVDTFTLYAASAMAANTILRSLLGGLFPLFGLSMYNSLGLGWGNSLLAFLGVALLPIPFIFYYYGERIRTNPKWQVKL